MRQIKWLLCLFACIILMNCTSSTEDKGLTKIKELYNCEAFPSFGTSMTTTEANKYVEIELSDGNEYYHQEDPQMIASNAALMFYISLTPDEKKKYAEITCIVNQIKNGNNQSTSYDISTEVLEIVEKKLPLYNECIRFIEIAAFERIYDRFVPEAKAAITLKEFNNMMKEKFTRTSGTTKIYTLGFRLFQNEELGINGVKIFGAFTSNYKNYNKFGLSMNQKPKDGKIYTVY